MSGRGVLLPEQRPSLRRSTWMSEALKKPTSQTWTAMCAALSELGRQLLVEVHYFIGSSLELQNHHHGARTLDCKVFCAAEYGWRPSNELLMRDAP
nr:hypothetical protein Itr_chr02CG11180 [Ipomoea trifida]